MKANNKANNGLPDTDEILRELADLRKVMCARVDTRAEAPDDAEAAVALFRLCPGMTLEQWENVSRDFNLAQWLTVPLDEDAYPHLLRLQRELEELSFESEHDALTGLANRRSFERVLDMEMERSRRNRTPLSLALLDLDDFKVVNDEHGHPKGDEVLATVAGKLMGIVRRYDLAARIGGEEFALIFAGVGQTKARNALDRLQDAIRDLSFETADGRGRFGITCSIGLASYKGKADVSPRELVALSDKALYEAKHTGKNAIVTAPIPDIDMAERETLVHSDEKKFLFTGS